MPERQELIALLTEWADRDEANAKRIPGAEPGYAHIATLRKAADLLERDAAVLEGLEGLREELEKGHEYFTYWEEEARHEEESEKQSWIQNEVENQGRYADLAYNGKLMALGKQVVIRHVRGWLGIHVLPKTSALQQADSGEVDTQEQVGEVRDFQAGDRVRVKGGGGGQLGKVTGVASDHVMVLIDPGFRCSPGEDAPIPYGRWGIERIDCPHSDMEQTGDGNLRCLSCGHVERDPFWKGRSTKADSGEGE